MICSRKEFEDLCNISTANYTTYRSRGKIFEQFDGDELYIDTDHPVNKSFYENRKVVIEKKIIEKVSGSIIDNDPVYSHAKPAAKSKPLAKRKSIRNSQSDPAQTKGSAKFDLEVDKLDADVRLKEVTIAEKELKLAILSNNNVPISIVKEAFSLLGKSILTGYRDYIEQEIATFCRRNKISDKERVSMISSLVTGLNLIHEKSVNNARSTMKNGIKNSNTKQAMESDSDETNDEA